MQNVEMSEQTIEVESWSRVSKSSSETIIEVEFSSRVSKSLLEILKFKSIDKDTRSAR